MQSSGEKSSATVAKEIETKRSQKRALQNDRTMKGDGLWNASDKTISSNPVRNTLRAPQKMPTDSATSSHGVSNQSLSALYKREKHRERPASAYSTRTNLISAEHTVSKLKKFDREQSLRYGLLPLRSMKVSHDFKRRRPQTAPLKRKQQRFSMKMLETQANRNEWDTIHYQRLLSTKEHSNFHRNRLKRIILGKNW